MELEAPNVSTAIASCDRLLIVAAAGLSISDTLPNNPYHSPVDFARHYPACARFGYRTSYHAMGLGRDERVPAGVRVAYQAKHFLNMSMEFPPTDGYTWLLRVASTFKPEDTFVWTSNVDRCFERAGFDPARIYTTQGECNRMQCGRPECRNVWDAIEQFRAIDAASDDGTLSDLSLAPRCPKCGCQWPNVLPNLRGGDWFDCRPYKDAGLRLQHWLDQCVLDRAHVSILEVGVGPNTPVVTRIPACAFASALKANGGQPAYLRVNPDPPEGPSENPSREVPFFKLQEPWRAMKPLLEEVISLRAGRAAKATSTHASDSEAKEVQEQAKVWQQRYHSILESLRRPRS
jgi:NAD-dependent SIR2 family protein deacetylase